MTSVCTGRGASETRALILNDGRPNPHPTAGTAYARISRDEILHLIANPPSVAKEQGQWIIPSEYNGHDARSHAAQRQQGSFWWLAADIDKGGPSLQAVMEAMAAVLPGVYFVAYASRSSTRALPKWRILIPLAQPLTGSEYSGYQEAFFDALEHCGLELDRTLARAGQLVYLPNRGEYYDWQAGGQNLLSAKDHAGLKALADQYIEINNAIAATAGSDRQEGMRSHLAAFRRKHSIEELLRLYGYVNKPGTNHWRSPLSQSGSYSTQAFDDHWRSLSHNDAAAGLGKATANGSRYGDAFDLYVYYNCQGNREQAELYAKQCLAEEDAYHTAWGEHIWFGLVAIGNKLGPAGQVLEMERSAQRALEIQAEPEIIDTKHDWKVAWPPGIVGEAAKYIYRTAARPVKQYAIAQALYMMSAIAGSRYTIDRNGVNIYLMVIGNTGVGKGESKRGRDRILSALESATQDPQGIAARFDHSFPSSAPALMRMFKEPATAAAIYKEDAHGVLDALASGFGGNGDRLRDELTSFYEQSGPNGKVGAITYSKVEDKKDAVYQPALTVGLDIQIDSFNEFLGKDVMQRSGFVARFIYVHRYGPRMHAEEVIDEDPPESLIETMKTLWNGLRMQPPGTRRTVVMDEGARARFKAQDREMTDWINENEKLREHLNRLHTNTQKIAALLAIGTNPIAPVITEEMYNWAEEFVLPGHRECAKLIESGNVGSGERVRVARGIRAIRDYVKMPRGRRVTYKVPKSIDHLDNVICENYLMYVLSRVADFRGSDTGFTTEQNVRRTIDEMVRQEILVEASRDEVALRYQTDVSRHTKQRLFFIGPAFD